MRNKIVILSSLAIGMMACTTEEKFPSIDKNFAGPVDVAAIGSYGFVLNSDFDRNYNTGSIVTIDPSLSDESQKLHSLLVPRMGRSLFAQGSYLIATYDRTELEGMGAVEVYQAAADGSLSRVFSQELDCSPIAATLSADLDWGAVSCLGGEVFIAPINTSSIGDTQFQYVRNYGYARRALHIYKHTSSSQSFLLAFPTDMGEQTAADLGASDTCRYNEELAAENADNPEAELCAGDANEVPDYFENIASNVRQFTGRYPYQMAILNLTVAEENGFPVKSIGSLTEAEDTISLANGKTVYEHANQELKFIYFTLSSIGDVPDANSGVVVTDPDNRLRYYRTNFWQLRAGADSQTIYLSHRGRTSSGQQVNNILELSIKGSFTGPAEDSPQPFTESFADMFSVQRIEGSENLQGLGYPGDFVLAQVNESKEFVFVNQFRDEAYWSKTETLYAIDVAEVRGAQPDGPVLRWRGGDFNQSAYQLAVINSAANLPAYLISCSFYGDSVLVFDIDFNDGIDVDEGPSTLF